MVLHLSKPDQDMANQASNNNHNQKGHDIFKVSPNPADDSLKTTAEKRFEYGIHGLIEDYRNGNPDCKNDIMRYLLTSIQPSALNPISCLVPLCKAWSPENRGLLVELLGALLPSTRITWIPDPKVTKSMDPLAVLLAIAKHKRSVIVLVRVLVEYCLAHTNRFNNLTFLSPLFASMPGIMEYYSEDALEYIGRIAYIQTKHPTSIWKNHVCCQKIAPFRFSIWSRIRRVWMSALDIKREASSNSIMQLKFKTDNDRDNEDNLKKPGSRNRRFWMSALDFKREANSNSIMQHNLKTDNDGDNEDNLEKMVFMATFDALWFDRNRNNNTRKWIQGGEASGKGGGGEGMEGTSEKEGVVEKKSVGVRQRLSRCMSGIAFDEGLVQDKTSWWKVVAEFLSPRAIECYDFSLEFLDNPAIAALVTFKWETIGFMYWFLRFFCQCIYYILIITAVLTQVYSPEPSKLYGVFVTIIVIGVVFVFLEILQAMTDVKRYIKSHYNFVDVLELRISRSVCKYVTIVQQAVSEIFVFIVIVAGFMMAFTITILHMLRSCPYEGCIQGKTKFPSHLLGGLYTTAFFLSGRFDAVSDELDANMSNDWALRLVMVTFLVSISILMMNVLIALINVAFAKGDDSWRLVWIQSRLRYIESAENLSYRIPGFRRNYDWFPNQVYFTATDEERRAYLKKYPKSRRDDPPLPPPPPPHSKSVSTREEDENSELGTPTVRLGGIGDDLTGAGVGRASLDSPGALGSPFNTPTNWQVNRMSQESSIGRARSESDSSMRGRGTIGQGESSERHRMAEELGWGGEVNVVAGKQEQKQEQEMGKGKGNGTKEEEASDKDIDPTVLLEFFNKLENRVEGVLLQAQQQALESQRWALESQRQMELNRQISQQQMQALIDRMIQLTLSLPASSSSFL
ncbi:hypothetical protein BGZ95_002202 [Linnemannia exigua]|uniref:Ion transport domain-containing protein n=1 Tax=Linnemannia exigua TaxID=604196 RepID=A0AAD4H277_9FUNG|nr:hypothetical protein BGZ95_002202 [Linnemannia exigua]